MITLPCGHQRREITHLEWLECPVCGRRFHANPNWVEIDPKEKPPL